MLMMLLLLLQHFSISLYYKEGTDTVSDAVCHKELTIAIISIPENCLCCEEKRRRNWSTGRQIK